MNSAEYLAGENNFIREMVEQMQEKAPGLRRYEMIYKQIKEYKGELKEVAKFYKDTVEDIERLKIREKYFLGQEVDENEINDHESNMTVSCYQGSSMLW